MFDLELEWTVRGRGGGRGLGKGKNLHTPTPLLVFDLGTNFFLCSVQPSGAIEIKNRGHNFL